MFGLPGHKGGWVAIDFEVDRRPGELIKVGARASEARDVGKGLFHRLEAGCVVARRPRPPEFIATMRDRVSPRIVS